MSKEEVVDAIVAEIQAGQLQVLKVGVAKAFDSNPGSGNDDGISQADVDAAVSAARAEDQLALDAKIAEDQAALEAVKFEDAQALSDAQLAGQEAIAQVQSALDAMTAKDALDLAVVQGFKDKVSGLQSALDQIKNLITPDPIPEPEPTV